MFTREPAWDQVNRDDFDEDRAPYPVDEDTTIRLPIRDSVSVETMVAVIKGQR